MAGLTPESLLTAMEKYIPGQIAVGGEMMRSILSPERITALYRTRETIELLGNDHRLWLMGNPDEGLARRFVRATEEEALVNCDRKIVLGDAVIPSEIKTAEYLYNEFNLALWLHENRSWLVDRSAGTMLRVRKGANGYDNRLQDMLTVTLCDLGFHTLMQYHVSHPLSESDRRIGQRATRFQNVGLVPGSNLFYDHATQTQIGRDQLPLEALPSNLFFDLDTDNRLIQVSRIFMNFIRGNGVINTGWDPKSWVPKIRQEDIFDIQNILMDLPFLVMDNKVTQNTVEEFKFRLMSMWLLNKNLFMNLVNYLPLGAAMPVFRKYQEKREGNRFFDNVSHEWGKSDNIIPFMQQIMGDEYDGGLSVLANLGKMFRIGIE